MLEILVFFHMESCNVDWQVHSHSALRCEVERLDDKCELKVKCKTGRSAFNAEANTLIELTEEASLRCKGLWPGQVKSQALRVESETWALIACRRNPK